MTQKIAKEHKKLSVLDDKNRQILNLLSDNSRATLKDIAKEVGLSIDSVKSRMDKMKAQGIITKFTIKVNSEMLGAELGAQVFIKLKNVSKERLKELTDYLGRQSHVCDVMAVMGDFDIFFVLLAKNTHEMDKAFVEIRHKFSDVIDDWRSTMITEIYKLEEYKY